MSHNQHRKEINCLNCNTEVAGPFCQNCGQENLEPKESIWHLIGHFFNDLTHFDGKFFITLKDLIIKPGFLSEEYLKGRRASYLNPVRMYFFTSALFFFIFFSLFKVENSITKNIKKTNTNYLDSSKYEAYKALAGSGPIMSRAKFDSQASKGVTISPGNYKSKAEYDSILLSGKKKHNWLERQLTYKNIELKEKYKGRNSDLVKDMMSRFLHFLPQMFFVLLPLFALILKLFYYRKKEIYYTGHIIFTIHFYIFLFIAMIIGFGLSQIKDRFKVPLLGYLGLAIFFYLLFYFYKAMRKFYKQSRAKTILKYCLILTVGTFLTGAIFVLFSLLSIFEI